MIDKTETNVIAAIKEKSKKNEDIELPDLFSMIGEI